MPSIIPKKSSVAGRIPISTDLEVGELAVNLADGVLYTKDGSNLAINLSGAPELHEHTLSQITDSGNLAAINTNGSTVNYLRGDGSWVTPPDTTYDVMSVAEGEAGTSTDLRTVRADFLKEIIEHYISLGGGGSGGGTSVSISNTAPVSPSNGDLWWDSVSGNLFIYYNDGDSSQWTTAFVGVKGDQGERGIQGIQGEKGDAGAGADQIIFSPLTTEVVTSFDVQSAIEQLDSGVRSRLFHIQHRVAGSTNSGSFSAGAWRDRPLNHVETNEIPNASFDEATLIITLPAGTYEVDIYSCAFYVQNNTAILRNVDDDSILMVGDAGLSNANGGYNNSGSTIKGRLVLVETTNIKLQHWCSTTRSNDGFGYRNVAAINSVPAIYADVRFWR